jgi:tRNA wybutosine-synthesizing protein 3
MQRDFFSQRKFAVLSKLDKSSIGGWDKRIISLCNKINFLQDFYTTSSCSGRIVLMLDKEKKSPNLFLKVWHELISFEELKEELNNLIKNKLTVKFKLEPPILHLVCKDLNGASELLEKAKTIGWRRSGINAFRKNIVLELNSTEKLEFPILKGGKILVNDVFLKLIVKEASQKLRKGWEKIEKLEKIV